MNNGNNLPYPAKKIMVEFAEKVECVEQGFIEGIYITGSLPLNDFYSNKSDIDFVVLCRFLPDDSIASRLKQIHQSIGKKHRKPDLSGVYLASSDIRMRAPENIKVLYWHEGKMRYQTFEMGSVSLFELKSNAITLFGDSASTLPISIDIEHLNKFLYKNINGYWSRWIKQHSSLTGRRAILIAFPRFTEWSVLGVARQLVTLQTGRIVSKTEAGLYCLENLPAKYHPIIQAALNIRKDNRTYPFVGSYGINPSFKRASETIDCVNYIIYTFNNSYSENNLL